jgi:diaminopimelate epimerase
MRLRFSKMHGLGNDFMVIDLVTQHVELDGEMIRQWADRRTGIGFDQLLIVDPPSVPDADFGYRIYNADGTRAEQCGNGARCFAKFVNDNELSVKERLTLETSTGLITTELHEDGTVEVAMGVPTAEHARIPYVGGAPGLVQSLDVDGKEISFIPVSVGNPHAVIRVDNVAAAPVTTLGPLIEHHTAFPERVNVGFCQIVDRAFVRVRVWERGTGETRACGTGACAAVVAGRLHGELDERVKVSLPGGKIRVTWSGDGAPVSLSGPACLVYRGELAL